MKGWEAIKAMQEGQCVRRGRLTFRRSCFSKLQYWYAPGNYWSDRSLYGSSIFADDWEIVPDPSKPAEPELYTRDTIPAGITRCRDGNHVVDHQLGDAAVIILNECRKMIKEELEKKR